MSGTENNQTGTLDERLRLGAGFAAADRPRILEALSALAPHLSGWEHDQVDLEVSLKDTEGPDQKVTLQAWLAGRAHLVATSHQRDLDHALAEVRREGSTRSRKRGRGASLASAGRPVIARLDPAGDSATPCIATPAWSLLAVVTMASTADVPRDLRGNTTGMLVGYERATGGIIARPAPKAA
jgi:hypothetical protein